jgi:8-oxo-(d)GTP phosphatase
VPVLLVRHAVAVGRRHWDGADVDRPLDQRGHRQADALVSAVGDRQIEQILSSPALRCVETVRPLGAARGLQVDVHADLAEGSTYEAVALVRSLVGGAAALCSHGDVIPRVLEHFVVHDGVDLGHDPHWAKASAWVLEDDGERFVKAFYLPPPA